MNTLELQIVSESLLIPTQTQFQLWIDTVLKNIDDDIELVVRVIDEPEMIQYNEQYRHKQGATNILSFPFEVPDGIDSHLLGDLLVCAAVLEKESTEQNKSLADHWAHIIMHGVLHLLGYDHVNDDDAEEMELLEIQFLQTININNPYEDRHNT